MFYTMSYTCTYYRQDVLPLLLNYVRKVYHTEHEINTNIFYEGQDHNPLRGIWYLLLYIYG